MSWLRRLLGLEKWKEVYCQNCALDITAIGEDVTNTGRVCCHNDNKGCVDLEKLKIEADKGPEVTARYLSPREVQREIRKGRLREFCDVYDYEVPRM
jgi:hypothetical protein